MKIRNLTKVAAPLWFAVAMTAACSDDNKDSDGEMPSSTATNTTTAPTSPNGSGPGPTPVGPGTNPGGTNTAGPNPSPNPSGTMPAPSSTAPMSACMNTAADGTLPEDVNGATWIFSYSDVTSAACMMPTTHCLDHTTPNSICFDGTAAPAGDSYECWGSGYGIQMAAADVDGNVTLAWDASAVGVAGVKFTLAGMAGGPKIRAQISQNGLPDDAAFVHGGGTADIGTDGEKILMFEDFTLPSWTTMANPDLADTVLDATQIKALQIQVVTVQTGAKVYNFCLSGLTWITADMTPVDVIAPEPPEGGDAGPTPVGDGGVEPGDASMSTDGGPVPTPGDGGVDAAVEEDGGAGGATEAGPVDEETDAAVSAGGMGAGGTGSN